MNRFQREFTLIYMLSRRLASPEIAVHWIAEIYLSLRAEDHSLPWYLERVISYLACAAQNDRLSVELRKKAMEWLGRLTDAGAIDSDPPAFFLVSSVGALLDGESPYFFVPNGIQLAALKIISRFDQTRFPQTRQQVRLMLHWVANNAREAQKVRALAREYLGSETVD